MSDGMIITRDELRLLPKVEPVRARITISPSVQAGYIVVELWFYGLKTVVTVEDLALNDLRPVEPIATPPLAPCAPSAEFVKAADALRADYYGVTQKAQLITERFDNARKALFVKEKLT